MTAKKRPHITFPDEVRLELSELESLLTILNEPLDNHLSSVFCTCTGYSKKLINYQAYLNKHYHVVLHGNCSCCGEHTSKYIDTYEGNQKALISQKLKKIYSSRI